MPMPAEAGPADGRCTCTGVGCWHKGRCTAWHGQPHPRTRERVVLDAAAGWCGPCAPHLVEPKTTPDQHTEPEPLFP